MSIRATCHACGRDFLFLQLYNADPVRAENCPHCGTHLGVLGVRHRALAADRAVASLVHTLEGIAARNPRFTVKAGTALTRVERALEALARPAADERDSVENPTFEQESEQRRAA